MDCNTCGRERLSRRTAVWAKRFYPQGGSETVPVCDECADRIGTGLLHSRIALVARK